MLRPVSSSMELSVQWSTLYILAYLSTLSQMLALYSRPGNLIQWNHFLSVDACGCACVCASLWSKGCNSTTEIEMVIIKVSVYGQNRIPSHQTRLRFSWDMYQTQPVLDGRRLSTDSLVYQFLRDWKEHMVLFYATFPMCWRYVKARHIFWRICLRVRQTHFPQNVTVCKSDE